MAGSDARLRQQNADLKREAAQAKARAETAERERDHWLAECVRLEDALRAARSAAEDARVEAGRAAEAQGRAAEPAPPSAHGPRVRRLAQGKTTLEDALEWAATAWPERLEVLETARKAARDAAAFERPIDALELLGRLANEYRDALLAGRGDRAGNEVFGEKFAATESETVKKNENALRLRTFERDGKPVEMLRHLKIGTKPSDAKTLRIHFHWDAETGRIVVGHCGRHLDFK